MNELDVFYRDYTFLSQACNDVLFTNSTELGFGHFSSMLQNSLNGIFET